MAGPLVHGHWLIRRTCCDWQARMVWCRKAPLTRIAIFTGKPNDPHTGYWLLTMRETSLGCHISLHHLSFSTSISSLLIEQSGERKDIEIHPVLHLLFLTVLDCVNLSILSIKHSVLSCRSRHRIPAEVIVFPLSPAATFNFRFGSEYLHHSHRLSKIARCRR